jgi:hypothetical protein
VARRFRRRKWSFVPGPSDTFTETPEGYAIDVGWRIRVGRGEELRWIRVVVVRGTLTERTLPKQSRKAIESRGWTAVDDILALDDPPTLLVVDQSGVNAWEPPQSDGETGAGVREPRRPNPAAPAATASRQAEDD